MSEDTGQVKIHFTTSGHTNGSPACCTARGLTVLQKGHGERLTASLTPLEINVHGVLACF